MPGKPLDCRGLACPNPVIKTKELIDQGDVRELTVLVDNPAAQENVSRFLQRAGFEVQVRRTREAFTVSGSRGGRRSLSDHRPERGRRPTTRFSSSWGATVGPGR